MRNQLPRSLAFTKGTSGMAVYWSANSSQFKEMANDDDWREKMLRATGAIWERRQTFSKNSQ